MSNLKVTTPSDREIAMSRTFDAPRQLVWDAHTKPELGPLWYSIAVAVTGPPCAWLGGVLYGNRPS